MRKYVLHFAFEYLDRGWPVIPVKAKTPAIAWSRYQEKRPPLAQVKEWFGANNVHDYNVAVVTGRVSKLVVIDCDTREDALWWRAAFPETPLAVRTGRGGSHFYYRYPETEVRNRAGILGRRIDVRAEGGLVVAPPSVHPNTGEPYRWEPWDHYAVDEIPLFDTSWLGLTESSSLLGRDVGRESNGSIRHGLAYIRQIEAVSGSGGHNATYRAACKLRDSGLTADEALQALRDWNETNAKPPWTAKEIAHKVHDAYSLA